LFTFLNNKKGSRGHSPSVEENALVRFQPSGLCNALCLPVPPKEFRKGLTASEHFGKIVAQLIDYETG